MSDLLTRHDIWKKRHEPIFLPVDLAAAEGKRPFLFGAKRRTPRKIQLASMRSAGSRLGRALADRLLPKRQEG